MAKPLPNLMADERPTFKIVIKLLATLDPHQRVAAARLIAESVDSFDMARHLRVFILALQCVATHAEMGRIRIAKHLKKHVGEVPRG